MRHAIAVTTMLLLAGCATKPVPEYGVDAPNGTLIDAAEYNRLIATQGLGHYCADDHCDRLPRLIEGAAPIYPPMLLAAGVTGQATVLFTIDEQGRTTDFKVESASAPEFAAAAVEALKRWRFQPASRRQRPVAIRSRQVFPFELQ